LWQKTTLYDSGDMTRLKIAVEKKLIEFYNQVLNSNFGMILSLLDFILPKTNFDFAFESDPKANMIQKQSGDNIGNFAKTVLEANNFQLLKEPLFIFITPEAGKNLSNSVCNSLAESLVKIEKIKFIVVTRSGSIVNSNFIAEGTLPLETILSLKPDLIFFEIHTFFKDPGLLSEELLASVKEKTNSKIIGICFDIWRTFDHDCIQKWDPIVDYFIHMDKESEQRFNLNSSKMIFWPYVGWVITPPNPKVKLKTVFFSGNIKPSYRRSVLKFARKICSKINLNLTVNKFAQLDSFEIAASDIYLNSLHNSQFVLGLSQKTKDRVIVPFRSLEAIALGCTLIQQEMEDDAPLTELFTPNVHYLSFKSIKDLEYILSSTKTQYDEYVKIGLDGQKYMQENYSAENMWKLLLTKIQFGRSI